MEALVVLAIVSLSTTAAFSLIRRSNGDMAPTVQQQLASRIALERAIATKNGEAKTFQSQDLLRNLESCSSGAIVFHPDGSVFSDGVCVVLDGAQKTFQVSPIYGTVSEAPS